jgi:hypothetical protein
LCLGQWTWAYKKAANPHHVSVPLAGLLIAKAMVVLTYGGIDGIISLY